MGSLQPGQGGLGKFVITGYAHLPRNRSRAGVLSGKGTPEKECGIAHRRGIVLDIARCAPVFCASRQTPQILSG
jgi:hypothetical protein